MAVVCSTSFRGTGFIQFKGETATPTINRINKQIFPTQIWHFGELESFSHNYGIVTVLSFANKFLKKKMAFKHSVSSAKLLYAKHSKCSSLWQKCSVHNRQRFKHKMEHKRVNRTNILAHSSSSDFKSVSMFFSVKCTYFPNVFFEGL